MSDKWTDKLPSLMEGYEEAAPEGLWEGVSAGVAPKRRWAVAWWVGGSLAAAAAVALVVFLWRPEQSERALVPEATLAEAVTVLEDAPEVIPEVVPEVVPQVVKPLQQKVIQTVPETPIVAPAEEPVEEPKTKEEPAKEQPKTTVPETKPATQNTTVDVFSSIGQSPKPKKHDSKIQVTLGTGGFLANASGGTTRGYGIPYNPGMPMTTLTKAGGEPITVPMLGRNRESTTQSSHRQSVKLNIGISYSFAPRWSVGSGVTYTVLRSEYTTDSGNTVSKATRQLHYLGIPLNLQFMVFEWRELGIGVNAGGMWETAVGSRLNKMEYVGDELASESQEFPGVKDQRWSINGGVSLQYQLFRYGAIFVQPGVSWHIPGNNEVESYYTVHPVAFDFTLGYRFTF